MKKLLLILFMILTISAWSRPLFKVEGSSVTVDIEGVGKKARIVKIDFLTESSVKITTCNNATLSDKQSLIFKTNLRPVKIKADYKDSNVEIGSDKVIVNVEENGLVRIFNRESGGRMIVESDKMFNSSTIEQGAYSYKQRLFLGREERLFGLGQVADSKSCFNLRGQKIEVVQNDEAIASPVFYSDRGYAVIWDNYSASSFSDTKGFLEISSSVADEIQYVFIYGPEWSNIVSEIRTMTGKVLMLPRWAYGLWHLPSSLGTTTQDAIVAKYHQAELPSDKYDDANYDLFKKELALEQSEQKARYSNALPLFEMQSDFEKFDTLPARVCLPSKSAMPGMQKYGTFVYTGNVKGCWNSLKNQITSGMNISLSGNPYWSTNIGGVASSCENTPYPELLTRWYQFAAFNPIFQISETGREIWDIAKPGDKYYEAMANAIKLRYRLLPYIYSSAYNVYKNNESLVYPLMFNALDDPKIYEYGQQFMFGNALMVCPVTEAGVTEKKVYLPKNKDNNGWVDFWTGKHYDGGSEITTNVTIDNIPLFVKDGSIIPMTGPFLSTEDSLGAPVEIRIYPGKGRKTFIYYDDDHKTKGYKEDFTAKIIVAYNSKDNTIELSGVEGFSQSIATPKIFNVVVVTEEKGTGLEKCSEPVVLEYKGKRIKAKVE